MRGEERKWGTDLTSEARMHNLNLSQHNNLYESKAFF